MRHRPPRGTGQLTGLEQTRRLLEDLSALCAHDGVTVESAAPDAIDGVSPRLLAAIRPGSPAGEPILLRGSGGWEVIAVVDGQGHPSEIWEAIRARTRTRVVIRRRVEPDGLVPGLTAIAVKSDDRIGVFVSDAIPARLQRAGGRCALRAARRAGWTRDSVPAALLLLTGASLCRAALASGARRFAVAGSAALIVAFAIGAVLTVPAASPPGRAVITPVTPSSTRHVRGAATRAAHSPRHAQDPRPGRARVVAHRQGAPTRTARPAPTGATPTAVTGTPTRSSPSPHPSSSPDPSPSPSPTKTRHCILLFC